MTAASDMTLRHSHRCALRRIERGEPVGDLGEALGALYLHDLIRDDPETGKPMLSDDGRKVLAAHDALTETRRVERPRLDPKAMPPRWKRVESSHGGGNTQRYEHVDVRCAVETWGDQVAPLWVAAKESYAVDGQTVLRALRDVVALLEWVGHERAVRAQEEQP